MSDIEPGWYYIRLNEEHNNTITIDYCHGGFWECYFNRDVAEVLDKVPTYEECKRLKQHTLGEL